MNLKELSVLVVDDQLLMREILRSMLAQMLIQRVTAVEGPVEAATLIRAGKTFDLALVDWEMQPASGLDFVKALRAGVFGALASMPVIMVTGHADQERVVAAKEVGIHGFLVKPVDGRKLLAMIQATQAKPRPAAAAPRQRPAAAKA